MRKNLEFKTILIKNNLVKNKSTKYFIYNIIKYYF